MKANLPLLLVTVCLSACVFDGPTKNKACGVSDPAQHLPWLKELIEKAEADRNIRMYKGNYLGQIYQTRWRNRDAFWTNFMMGSGGIYARLYACDGQQILLNSTNPSATEIKEIQKTLNKDKPIYSNMP